uniref:NADH-ubiquinone oxidoreductase chain 6 n=1 Tax=Crypsis chinensis TaxID=2984370 RepID=A0A978AXQ2_9CUCU|nr:NADH dehydrogenase subunit 6 [Crypsis chinensis]UYB79092.1 NADH dehydrogenase subunit 6 [Crypsis chinensis]
MMTILMSTMLSTSLMLMFSKHPMYMGMILLIQTMMTSAMTGFMNNDFWYSYILFLIMIGGVLVMFMYMTSIASNEKFLIMKKSKIIMLPVVPMMILLFFNYPSTFNDFSTNFMSTSSHYNSFSKYFSSDWKIIMMLMIFLLLAMIITVKVSSFKEGSIRQMN